MGDLGRLAHRVRVPSSIDRKRGVGVPELVRGGLRGVGRKPFVILAYNEVADAI